MTEAEAIKILEKEKAYMDSHGGDMQSKALDMAINALEKQIAKNPYYVQYDANKVIGNWHCPICNRIVNKGVTYCECGQKLDIEV